LGAAAMMRAARSPSWRPGAASPPPSPEAAGKGSERERERAELATATPPRRGEPASPRGATPTTPVTPRGQRTARELLHDATGVEPDSPRGALLALAALGPLALAAGSALSALAARSSGGGAGSPLRARGGGGGAGGPTPTAARQQQPSQQPREAQHAPPADVARLKVLTFNIGGVNSRWRERLPVLREYMAAVEARRARVVAHLASSACAPRICCCARSLTAAPRGAAGRGGISGRAHGRGGAGRGHLGGAAPRRRWRGAGPLPPLRVPRRDEPPAPLVRRARSGGSACMRAPRC
jgi:hypothetical protein